MSRVDKLIEALDAIGIEASYKTITLELERVGLGAKADATAGGINLAERKRLEVARALATRPQLLLLDEVMAGLNPTETSQMIELINKLAAEGMTVVLIEHVMKAVMSVCSRVFVVHHGEKIAEGTPVEITENPRVIEQKLNTFLPPKSRAGDKEAA